MFEPQSDPEKEDDKDNKPAKPCKIGKMEVNDFVKHVCSKYSDVIVQNT